MSKIGPFITGAALGALAALMFAPQAGEQTRAFVAEKANAVAGEAKDFGAGFPGSAQDALKNVQDMGATLVKDATSKGQDLVSGAQARVKEAAGQPAEVDADELRQKIEAARQRIAAQVMENAAQGAAVDVAAEAPAPVEEVAEAVVEEAADIAETAKHAAVEKVEEVAEAAEEA